MDLQDVTATSRKLPAVWLALLVGIPVSAVLLWLAVRHVDLREVWNVIAAAQWPLLFGALTVLGVVYVLQALRWRVIVGGERPSRRRYVELVLGGIACNNVLPGRVGELFRARQVAVEADLPSGRGLATVMLDRIFDTLALMVFLVVALRTVVDETWSTRIAIGSSLLLACMGVALLFARRYIATHVRDRRSRGRLRRLVRDTLEGLALPLGWRRIVTAATLSVAAWCGWAVAAVLVAHSIGIDLGILDALFVTAVINFGVAIPSSPGFVGTFQWLGVASLGAVGVSHESGLAFAIVMHALWYVPTTLVGLCVLAGRTDWRLFGGRAQKSLSLSSAPKTLVRGPASD